VGESLDSGQLSAKGQAASAAVHKIVQLMNIDVSVSVSAEDEENLLINCTGVEQSMLLEEAGATLSAMQFLVNRMVSEEEGPTRVLLDVGNYRDLRLKSLEAMAEELGERVLNEGKPLSTSAIGASDRRIIHMMLAEKEGVRTRSEGDGLLRRVVILTDRE